MNVTKLQWISKAAQEAELIVSDNIHECLVFSQPCSVKVNEFLSEPIHALDVESLMRIDDRRIRESIEKTNESYFSHYCISRVVDAGKSIVSVGGIIIELEGAMPGWIMENDLVEFKCSRLDIW